MPKRRPLEKRNELQIIKIKKCVNWMNVHRSSRLIGKEYKRTWRSLNLLYLFFLTFCIFAHNILFFSVIGPPLSVKIVKGIIDDVNVSWVYSEGSKEALKNCVGEQRV